MSKQFCSSPDMLQFVAELNVRRMPMVFDAWHRKLFGTRLQGMQNIARLCQSMTKDQLADYKIVRDLHWRYERDEFWHTGNELNRVIAFALFLLRLYAECKHQRATQPEFDKRKMSQQHPLDPGWYKRSKSLVENM